MMNCLLRTCSTGLALCCGLASCSWDATDDLLKTAGIPLLLQCSVSQPVRSSATGFDDGDRAGVYVVNHDNGNPGTLLAVGNYVHNAPFIHRASDGVWEPASGADVRWKDMQTPADIYCYYPFGALDGAPDAVCRIPADQRTGLSEGDLLWGKAAGVKPQTDPVEVIFRHLFSKVRITVHISRPCEGYDYENLRLEFPSVCTSARIHLADGSLQAEAGDRQSVTPYRTDSVFEAILIPQTVPDNSVFFRVCLGGKMYDFCTEVTLDGGRLYRFDIVLQPATLTVSINQITSWEMAGPVTLNPSGAADGEAGSGLEDAGVRNDREALVALYEQMDGSNWKNSDNWGSDAPLNAWKGVSVNDDGRVRILNLSNNNLSGGIPACIGRLTELNSLQLYGNRLSGGIPDEIFGLSKLTTLGLYKNQLSGDLSDKVGRLSLLTSLNLSQNQFSGGIPDSIGRLTKINTLNLSQNSFSGGIPDCLEKLTRMSSLNLSDNMLTGNLPEGMAAIGAIKTLNVSGNRLSGTLPSAYTAHSNWSIWNPDVNILPQQEGFGLATDQDVAQ